MSFMNWDTPDPLYSPSLPFIFNFIKTSTPLKFSSFSLKLIQFCLVRSQRKSDTHDGALTINPNGQSQNQLPQPQSFKTISIPLPFLSLSVSYL